MPIWARVQQGRRLVLPKEVAEHLHVGTGDMLVFVMNPDGVLVQKGSVEIVKAENLEADND